jgi:hypothetical protein
MKVPYRRKVHIYIERGGKRVIDLQSGEVKVADDLCVHPNFTFEDFKKHCNITSNPSWKDVIKAFKNNKTPSMLFQNESYYFELREVLMCCYNETPKCEDDIHNDIKSINAFKNYNIDIYTKQVDLTKHYDSVWMLLQEPKAYDNILTKKIDYCIVCAMPLKDKNEMKVYFIMLENKMRDSLII